MTPELGIENAKKHLLFYLDTMSREDAQVLFGVLDAQIGGHCLHLGQCISTSFRQPHSQRGGYRRVYLLCQIAKQVARMPQEKPIRMNTRSMSIMAAPIHAPGLHLRGA